MNTNSILLLCAVLPVFAILIFIYYKDTQNKEPLWQLIKCFLVGCFSVLPAILLETILSFHQPSGIIGQLFDGYIVAGFSEELTKLLLLALCIWRSKYFDEYFDGIVYAVFISMGFACVENILYVFNEEEFVASFTLSLMRALLSIPGHFLFAVAMGYHLSLAKFDYNNKFKHLCYALLLPWFLHGTYDALLMLSDYISQWTNYIQIALFFAFIYFDIKMWKLGLRRIKALQELSKQQDFDRKNPFNGFQWNF